jgi:hypothetical protein
LQWLQDPSEINGDKNNVRCEASDISRMNLRGARNNLVKDGNGELLADSHNILNRWKSYFSQLMNVHNACDIRHIEVHTANH